MESTGSYWQSLYLVLIANNFEVILVPSAVIKEFKKTDIIDDLRIQQLHTLGLLRSCYLPDATTESIRSLTGHRKSVIEDASRYTNRMQKCFRLMNCRLDVVINDITGVSDIKMIEAILNDERDAIKLAALAHNRVKKSQEEIADALHGNFIDEYLFELENVYRLYKETQKVIVKIDEKIASKLSEIISNDTSTVEVKKKQLKGKN